MSSQVTNTAISPRNRVMVRGPYTEKEGIANGAITPGDLVKRVTTDKDKVVVHSTAGGNAQKLFAIELDFYGGGNAVPGASTTLAIDEAYASGDNVKLVSCQTGAELFARVAAGAAAITIGDALESAGNGTLRKHTPPSQAVAEGGSASYTIAQNTQAVVAYALETVDNSGGGSAVRIRVEVA